MRMNQNQSLNAADIINTYEEYEIISILRNYGEVINPACFAKNIIKNRPIYKTSQLIEAVSNCFPNHKKNKILAQVFQALRIEVNNEIDSLKELLKQSVEVLNPQGRLVIISYHSLEDRIVKNFFKSGNFEGKIEKDFYGNPLVELKTITKKPITPELSELEQNSRSRSAKLRIAEKK